METISSPLEQFQVYPSSSGLFIYNNISFFFYSPFLLCILVCMSLSTLPTSGNSIIMKIFLPVYFLVYDLLYSHSKKKGIRFFPYLLFIFMLVSILNILGLVPFSATLTSHLVITLTLSTSVFMGINVIGLYLYGIRFLFYFMPTGVPFALSPLIVLIELFSYIFRILSMSVRLFANMTAGHILVKILGGFAWQLASIGSALIIPLILLITIILLLETSIAVLQAYVFTVLGSIYLKDVINLPEH